MQKRHKEMLIDAVTNRTIWEVQEKFKQIKLIHDQSYFDYRLLRIALRRNHRDIVNFLLDLGCRVTNPNIQDLGTPLHLALKTDCSIINKILEMGGSIYERDRKGDTAIIAGFKRGFYNAVFTLLNYSCSYKLTQQSKEKLTPMNRDAVRHFHVACILSNLRVVEAYINRGFDVNCLIDSYDFPEYGGQNPLHYAVKKNDLDLFELLLKSGGNLGVKDGLGQTPLHNIYYSGIRGSAMAKKAFIYGNSTKFLNCVDPYGVSHFHLCCMLNYPDFVNMFLYNGAGVNDAIFSNCSLNPGFTPLHIAVQHNCNEVVELLLKNGANRNAVDANGFTALHLACEKPNSINSSITHLLLNFNANPAAPDKKGVTPLHMAFYKATDLRDGIMDKFIARVPLNVNSIDDKGLSYFHIVCTRNDTSRVYEYLESGVDVNSCVSSGLYCRYTALHFAVMCNQKDIVEMLLQRKAQVNAKTGVHKLTPLHIACKFYMKFRAMGARYDYEPVRTIWRNRCQIQRDIIALLFRHGADVSAHDSQGKTPLIQACVIDAKNFLRAGFNFTDDLQFKKCVSILKEIIDILLSHNASVNTRAKRQYSIMHFLTLKCETLNRLDEWLIGYLISKGADVNVADSAGITPLFLAVQASNLNMVLLLLKYKAKVNATTKDSTTILEMAIRRTDEYPDKSTRNVLRTILEYDVDVNVRNKHGNPLLQECIKRRMMYPIKRLLESGVDIHMEDSSGKCTYSTLLEWETELGEMYMVAEPDYPKIVRMMFIHIQKLLALGLPVKSDIQRSCLRLLHRYENAMMSFEYIVNLKYRIDFRNLELIHQKCVDELESMKRIQINNRTTLYDVLQRDVHTLSKQIRNSNLVKIMEDDKSFPFYFSLLKLKYRKACLRRNEMDDAVMSLSHISGFYLPHPCSDLVMKYLTSEDLITLNFAINPKKGFKRKLSDNDPTDNLVDNPSSKGKLKAAKRLKLNLKNEDLKLD